MAYLIQTLVSAVVVYVSTSIDDLFILMVLFGQPHSRRARSLSGAGNTPVWEYLSRSACWRLSRSISFPRVG